MMATLAQEFAVPSFLARPESGKTVLVVEDNRFVRRAASELLRGSGFKVLEAESVAAAKALFRLEPRRVDALLCDAVLPDGSGVELCRRLTESKDMRAILTSGYPRALPTQAWEEKTGNCFLSKPYSAELLIAALRRVLANPLRPRDPLLPGLIPDRVENLPG